MSDLEITTVSAGRPTKFTPERVDQIKNLVERGTSRDDIAAMIGVTVGTLQVTCSRLGVSLRRIRPGNGVSARKMDNPCAPPRRQAAMTETNGGDITTTSITVQITHRGETRAVTVPIADDLLARLALEAFVRDVKISELITASILEALNRRP
jgi:hypothetical protein